MINPSVASVKYQPVSINHATNLNLKVRTTSANSVRTKREQRTNNARTAYEQRANYARTAYANSYEQRANYARTTSANSPANYATRPSVWSGHCGQNTGQLAMRHRTQVRLLTPAFLGPGGGVFQFQWGWHSRFTRRIQGQYYDYDWKTLRVPKSQSTSLTKIYQKGPKAKLHEAARRGIEETRTGSV